MNDARELAARRFRHELEDNGGFTAGEMAMLVETYDRAFSDGIRQARDAVAEDLATIENGGGGVLRTWSDRGVTLGPMPGEVADAITRVIAKAATGFAD